MPLIVVPGCIIPLPNRLAKLARDQMTRRGHKKTSLCRNPSIARGYLPKCGLGASLERPYTCPRCGTGLGSRSRHSSRNALKNRVPGCRLLRRRCVSLLDKALSAKVSSCGDETGRAENLTTTYSPIPVLVAPCGNAPGANFASGPSGARAFLEREEENAED